MLIERKIKVLRENPYIRYLLPLLVFVVLGASQGMAENSPIFWSIYSFKIIATAALLWFLFRAHWQEIEGRPDVWSVITGIMVFVLWLVHYEIFSKNTTPAFDPHVFESPAMMALALGIRMIGAVLLVPLLEEIVWRSFIMRWLIKEDFLSVRLGSYTFFSFWLTVFSFMLVHPMWQWSVAAFAGFAYGFYLVRTRNLWGCIVAHAVTNLGISLYAIFTGTWGLWG